MEKYLVCHPPKMMEVGRLRRVESQIAVNLHSFGCFACLAWLERQMTWVQRDRETDRQKVEEVATLDVNKETGLDVFLVQRDNLQIYCRDTLLLPFPPFEKHSLLCH